MSKPSSFRAWLKRRRLERGLTQEALGELAGYAGQTITKIEGGQHRPSPQLAHRLAEVLALAPVQHAAWMTAALAGAEPEAITPETDVPTLPPPRPPTPSPGLPAYLTPFVGRRQRPDRRTGADWRGPTAVLQSSQLAPRGRRPPWSGDRAARLSRCCARAWL